MRREIPYLHASVYYTIFMLHRKGCHFGISRFKWSNLMDEEKTTTSDVDREMVSMMFAAAVWHMEHAQWVS